MGKNAWSKSKKQKNRRAKKVPDDKSKLAEKKAAKEKYFSQDLSKIEHIDAKRQFNVNAGIRPEVVHCYGVDFMSAVDIVELFGENVKKLEWIDDSNVNLVCHDVEAANAVLDDAKKVDETWSTKDASYKDSVDGAERNVRLEIRKCTFADVKDENRKTEDSTYYKWNTARTLEENEKKKQKREAASNQRVAMNPITSTPLTPGVVLLQNRIKGSKGSSQSGKGGCKGGQGGDFGKYLEDLENANCGILGSMPCSSNGAESKKRKLSSSTNSAGFKGSIRCPLVPVNRAIGVLRNDAETNDIRIKVVKVDKAYGAMIHQRRKKEQVLKSNGEPVPKYAVGSLWTEWLKVNTFPDEPQLVHCLMFKKVNASDRFLICVPHPLMVDMGKVASALGLSVDDIKKVSVKECHGASGFPIFVCPPIGHEFSLPVKERMALEKKKKADESVAIEREPKDRLKLLLDSSLIDCGKQLLFDCGQSALIFNSCGELVRATKGVAVEGLASAAPPS
eukprot:gene732-139_t